MTAVSSGHYRVWWEDVVNLKVHATRSNIAWMWNGSCVSSASGQSQFEWLSLTGWSRDSYSGPTYTFGSCLWGVRVSTSATYRNGAAAGRAQYGPTMTRSGYVGQATAC